jgi:C1A family cysteine protease
MIRRIKNILSREKVHYDNFLIPIKKMERRRRRVVTCSRTPSSIVLPDSFSLADKIKKVYDQGSTSSCTANALCQCFNILNDKDPSFYPSRLYNYAKEREMEQSTLDLEDIGAVESDGIYCALTYGICSESLWPFSYANIHDRPPPVCDKDAQLHKIRDPIIVPQNIESIKEVLSSGCPIMTAILLYPSFYTGTVKNTGIVPMPGVDEKPLGGHEVLMIGYDNSTSMFLFVNSWGTEWGCQPTNASTRGYFWLPYNLVIDTDKCFCLSSFKGLA